MAVPLELSNRINPTKATESLNAVASQGAKFTDGTFPPNESSLMPASREGVGESTQTLMEKLTWHATPEIFQSKPYEIFKQIDITDIHQGGLGDCYFLASLSAIAEYPERLMNIFVTKKINSVGYYAIKCYVGGLPKTIVMDDWFPCLDQGDELQFPFSSPHGNEIWALLCEKAWAKACGNFANIESGNAAEAMAFLTGAPTESLHFDKMEPEDIWRKLNTADKKRHIMSTGCGREGVSEADLAAVGLQSKHEYSLIDAVEILISGKPVRLLKLRNPWGHKEWNGDWSDHSPLWTPETRRNLRPNDADDGIFFMPFNEYLTYYYDATICFFHDKHISSYAQVSDKEFAMHAFKITKPLKGYIGFNCVNERMLRDQHYLAPFITQVIGEIEEGVNNRIRFIAAQTINIDGAFSEVDLAPGMYVIVTIAEWRSGVSKVLTVRCYMEDAVDLKEVDFEFEVLGELAKSAAKGVQATWETVSPDIYSCSSPENSHLTYFYLNNQTTDKLFNYTQTYSVLNGYKLIYPVIGKTSYGNVLKPGEEVAIVIARTQPSSSLSASWNMSTERGHAGDRMGQRANPRLTAFIQKVKGMLSQQDQMREIQQREDEQRRQKELAEAEAKKQEKARMEEERRNQMMRLMQEDAEKKAMKMREEEERLNAFRAQQEEEARRQEEASSAEEARLQQMRQQQEDEQKREELQRAEEEHRRVMEEMQRREEERRVALKAEEDRVASLRLKQEEDQRRIAHLKAEEAKLAIVRNKQLEQRQREAEMRKLDEEKQFMIQRQQEEQEKLLQQKEEEEKQRILKQMEEQKGIAGPQEQHLILTCSQNHVLQFSFKAYPGEGGYTCNMCQKAGEINLGRWFCQECQFDICLNCRAPPELKCPDGHNYAFHEYESLGNSSFICIICGREKQLRKGFLKCEDPTCTKLVCMKCIPLLASGKAVTIAPSPVQKEVVIQHSNCGMCGGNLNFSFYLYPPEAKYQCNICKNLANCVEGRWFCFGCQYDLCQNCRPKPPMAQSDFRRLCEMGHKLQYGTQFEDRTTQYTCQSCKRQYFASNGFYHCDKCPSRLNIYCLMCTPIPMNSTNFYDSLCQEGHVMLPDSQLLKDTEIYRCVKCSCVKPYSEGYLRCDICDYIACFECCKYQADLSKPRKKGTIEGEVEKITGVVGLTPESLEDKMRKALEEMMTSGQVAGQAAVDPETAQLLAQLGVQINQGGAIPNTFISATNKILSGVNMPGIGEEKKELVDPADGALPSVFDQNLNLESKPEARGGENGPIMELPKEEPSNMSAPAQAPAQPPANAPFCKNYHQMAISKEEYPGGGFKCDRCGRSDRCSNGRWHCAECEFDLCAHCHGF